MSSLAAQRAERGGFRCSDGSGDQPKTLNLFRQTICQTRAFQNGSRPSFASSLSLVPSGCPQIGTDLGRADREPQKGRARHVVQAVAEELAKLDFPRNFKSEVTGRDTKRGGHLVPLAQI